LNQPSLGYSYDAGLAALRPIRGIAGAAFLGDAVQSDPLAAAEISPRQDVALAVSADDFQLRLLQLQANSIQSIPGAMQSPSRIVFSPSGRAAVLVGDKIQILTALTDSPKIQDLPMPTLAAAPLAVAISDDGQSLLLASGTQDTDAVWVLTVSGAIQLPLPGSVATAAFRRDSNDAVAITRNGDVYVIRNIGSAADIRQLYVGDNQTVGPVAAQFAGDGSRVFTANAGGTITAIDLQSGSAVALSCRCAPTSLAPLNSATLFRLTEISDHPVWLYDASSSDPRIWFVPVDSTQRSSK
jgi:hypothetical protein